MAYAFKFHKHQDIDVDVKELDFGATSANENAQLIPKKRNYIRHSRMHALLFDECSRSSIITYLHSIFFFITIFKYVAMQICM